MSTPWLVDAHLDLAWNALQWNRDLRLPAHVLRVREAAKSGPGRGRGTVALPDMREGGIALAFATLLARHPSATNAHGVLIGPNVRCKTGHRIRLAPGAT